MHFCKSANKENVITMLIPDIDKAFEDLERMSHDPAARAQYEAKRKFLLDYNTDMDGAYEDGFQKGIAQGKKEALQIAISQGKREGILVVARKLKAKGMSLNEMSLITDLPLSELVKL